MMQSRIQPRNEIRYIYAKKPLRLWLAGCADIIARMDKRDNEPICVVIIGQAASPQAAHNTVANYQSCPYAAMYAATAAIFVGVLVIPSSRRWWAELPQSEPSLIGAERATVLLAESPVVESPWSRGEVAPVLELSPCGESCPSCRYYRSVCEGCPATTWAIPA